MIQVGEFEATTQLPLLLKKVSQGEEVLITKHGKAVARLVPARQVNRSQVRANIDKFLAFRKGIKLDGLDWKVLRDEGRR